MATIGKGYDDKSEGSLGKRDYIDFTREQSDTATGGFLRNKDGRGDQKSSDNKLKQEPSRAGK